MLPIMILLLLYRLRKGDDRKWSSISIWSWLIWIAITVVLSIGMVKAIHAQEKKLSYSIRHDGDHIGNMEVKESRNGDRTSLRLDMQVRTRFIFSFSAKGTEEAVYDRGVMIYSFVYQDLNGTEKINKQTRLVGSSYVIKSKGVEENVQRPAIGYNMVCLYTMEPLQNKQVYCDKYQKFLPIQKIEEHHYRIQFPDNNSNDYYYQNGLCAKIKVDHSFYSVVMERENK